MGDGERPRGGLNPATGTHLSALSSLSTGAMRACAALARAVLKRLAAVRTRLFTRCLRRASVLLSIARARAIALLAALFPNLYLNEFIAFCISSNRPCPSLFLELT
jgi:uncharacterized membrane protein YoaK (UPF0700 family)